MAGELKILKEALDNDILNKIENFTDSFNKKFHGFGGNCGAFSIALNEFIGEVGEYHIVTNKHLWDNNHVFIGHVVLKVENSLFDADGETEWERIETWGVIEYSDSDNEDLIEEYNLSEEDCYDSILINLSKEKGSRAKKFIMDNTTCSVSPKQIFKTVT